MSTRVVRLYPKDMVRAGWFPATARELLQARAMLGGVPAAPAAYPLPCDPPAGPELRPAPVRLLRSVNGAES